MKDAAVKDDKKQIRLTRNMAERKQSTQHLFRCSFIYTSERYR
ncbi:unnamed protein product, partial [Larinioides sclopetarius]